MKIKVKKIPYQKIKSLKRPGHQRPQKPWWILRALIRILSIPDMWMTKFKYTENRMEQAGEGPYLILMNHSSFIDLKIAYKIFFPLPFCIVSTTDSFVGKSWLMRKLGCIPTQKYVSDVRLIMDMLHAIKKERVSVLMYPEAGYSFDGCTTTLPRKLGTLVKKLNVPVLTVITDGAYLNQPLYNELKKRKVNISAKLTCLLTQAEIQQMSVAEIDNAIDQAFAFDNFANQYKNQVCIDEPYRADGLHRILYRCPQCHTEGKMLGKGIDLHCEHCGMSFQMDEYGRMKAANGDTRFEHIPDWFNWQRDCVRKELEDDTYLLDTEVDIGLMLDYKALYMVGSGRLIHDQAGFHLTGCDGQLEYHQSPLASFGLNADYYWYEIGDVICIGNKECLYYCFPKKGNVVAKTRFAAEELYKRLHAQKATI